MKYLHTALVALLLLVILPTSGMATVNGSDDESFFLNSSYPAFHLTPARNIGVSEAVYGNHAKSDITSMSPSVQAGAFDEMLRQRDAAIQTGKIPLAKEIQNIYYDRQIQIQTSSDNEIDPYQNINQPPSFNFERELQSFIQPQETVINQQTPVAVDNEQNTSLLSSANILPLGESYDISFPEEYMVIFEFTSELTGDYKFFTGPYRGNGAANDTVLYLFADENLTQLIAVNDDANGTVFSELNISLPASTTVYLVLAGYNADSWNEYFEGRKPTGYMDK